MEHDDPLSPDRLRLISLEVADQARNRLYASLAPFAAIVLWFGISSYNDLKQARESLTEETTKTIARADSLRELTESMRILVQFQIEALTANNREAQASLASLRTYSFELANQAAGQREAVNTAIAAANSASTHVRQDFNTLRSTTRNEIDGLLGTASAATQMAQRAISIAEEGSVQTVGAKQLRQLYGTRFRVYFEGVTRDALREVVFQDENGLEVGKEDRLTSLETIPLPNAERPEVYVSVVNVLDIPGGLLRLNGSSRADAATFRITRVHPSDGQRAPFRTATQPSPPTVLQARNEN